MKVDEGDVGELGCMVKALKKQEKRKTKQNVVEKQERESNSSCDDDTFEDGRYEVEDDEEDEPERKMGMRKGDTDLDNSGRQAKRKKEKI